METIFLRTYEYLQPGGWLMVILILTSIWMWFLIFERILFFKKLKSIKDHPILTTQEEGKDGQEGRACIDLYVITLRSNLKRHLPMIEILAHIAPLFGLLGTVSGMITTFDVISIFGTGNAKAMAGGISRAMITTQAGLLVAIPGVFMSSLLNRRSRRYEGYLDELLINAKRVCK